MTEQQLDDFSIGEHEPNGNKHQADMLIIQINKLVRMLDNYRLDLKVHIINSVREEIHKESPFTTEPVDLIKWVKVDDVQANDYNPNKVAPPEMELLRHSIHHDGYTQPVVTWRSEKGREVIDGFHRSRVCREFKDVNDRVHGYLPVVTILHENTDKKDRSYCVNYST